MGTISAIVSPENASHHLYGSSCPKILQFTFLSVFYLRKCNYGIAASANIKLNKENNILCIAFRCCDVDVMNLPIQLTIFETKYRKKKNPTHLIGKVWSSVI